MLSDVENGIQKRDFLFGHLADVTTHLGVFLMNTIYPGNTAPPLECSSVIIVFFFYLLFFYLATLSGLRDLRSPMTRDGTRATAVKALGPRVLTTGPPGNSLHFLFIYLFIYGYVGSSFLCEGFL